MGNYKGKIQLGWEVPPEVKESFRDWCINKGVLVQEDCAGALVIWKHLPSIIREKAKLEAKGTPSIDAEFWKQFSQGLELAVQAQLNNLHKRPDEKL